MALLVQKCWGLSGRTTIRRTFSAASITRYTWLILTNKVKNCLTKQCFFMYNKPENCHCFWVGILCLFRTSVMYLESPLPLRFFALYSKNLLTTHTWNFLTFHNFWLRIPLWNFFSRKILSTPCHVTALLRHQVQKYFFWFLL